MSRSTKPEACTLSPPGEKIPQGRAKLTFDVPANLEALVSERALAEDWLRPEEDEAWQHLQPVR